MTLRAARMIDTPRLVDLLVDSHARSRYAGEVGVDVAYARKLIASMIQRNGGTHDGGSMVAVVENDEGVVVGFVAGILDRVYHIGDRLAANDVFLVATPDAPAMVSRRLLAAYITWADGVPNCIGPKLSWTDALPSGERIADVYERMGFAMVGGIYERRSVRAKEAA